MSDRAINCSQLARSSWDVRAPSLMQLKKRSMPDHPTLMTVGSFQLRASVPSGPCFLDYIVTLSDAKEEKTRAWPASFPSDMELVLPPSIRAICLIADRLLQFWQNPPLRQHLANGSQQRGIFVQRAQLIALHFHW